MDNIPTVNQVLEALLPAVDIGKAYMADQFLANNPASIVEERRRLLGNIELSMEEHESAFKKRIPSAIGLIRTGDTTHYSNIILVSA